MESGTLDAGITGMDWIKENDSEVVYVEELIYSKVSTRPARWVLAVAKDSPIKRPEDLNGMRVATEMVNFTKRYFEEAGIDGDGAFLLGRHRGQGGQRPGRRHRGGHRDRQHHPGPRPSGSSPS